MAEVKIPTSEPTPAEAPAPAGSRPENVPEKFWDAEKGAINTDALLSSYGQLEKANSTPPAETPTGDTPKEGEGAAAVEALGLPDNVAPFAQTFAEKGEFTPEDYTALAELGYSKEVVDQFVAGAVAQAEASNPNKAFEARAGSPDNVAAIAEWAAANIPQGDIDLFNKASAEGKPEAAALFDLIATKFEMANGKPASNRITGQNAPDKSQAFHSIQDQTNAINDPRYKTSPEYRAEVERRIAAGIR